MSSNMYSRKTDFSLKSLKLNKNQKTTEPPVANAFASDAQNCLKQPPSQAMNQNTSSQNIFRNQNFTPSNSGNPFTLQQEKDPKKSQQDYLEKLAESLKQSQSKLRAGIEEKQSQQSQSNADSRTASLSSVQDLQQVMTASGSTSVVQTEPSGAQIPQTEHHSAKGQSHGQQQHQVGNRQLSIIRQQDVEESASKFNQRPSSPNLEYFDVQISDSNKNSSNRDSPIQKMTDSYQGRNLGFENIFLSQNQSDPGKGSLKKIEQLQQSSELERVEGPSEKRTANIFAQNTGIGHKPKQEKASAFNEVKQPSEKMTDRIELNIPKGIKMFNNSDDATLAQVDIKRVESQSESESNSCISSNSVLKGQKQILQKQKEQQNDPKSPTEARKGDKSQECDSLSYSSVAQTAKSVMPEKQPLQQNTHPKTNETESEHNVKKEDYNSVETTQAVQQLPLNGANLKHESTESQGEDDLQIPSSLSKLVSFGTENAMGLRKAEKKQENKVHVSPQQYVLFHQANQQKLNTQTIPILSQQQISKQRQTKVVIQRQCRAMLCLIDASRIQLSRLKGEQRPEQITEFLVNCSEPISRCTLNTHRFDSSLRRIKIMNKSSEAVKTQQQISTQIEFNDRRIRQIQDFWEKYEKSISSVSAEGQDISKQLRQTDSDTKNNRIEKGLFFGVSSKFLSKKQRDQPYPNIFRNDFKSRARGVSQFIDLKRLQLKNTVCRVVNTFSHPRAECIQQKHQEDPPDSDSSSDSDFDLPTFRFSSKPKQLSTQKPKTDQKKPVAQKPIFVKAIDSKPSQDCKVEDAYQQFNFPTQQFEVEHKQFFLEKVAGKKLLKSAQLLQKFGIQRGQTPSSISSDSQAMQAKVGIRANEFEVSLRRDRLIERLIEKKYDWKSESNRVKHEHNLVVNSFSHMQLCPRKAQKAIIHYSNEEVAFQNSGHSSVKLKQSIERRIEPFFEIDD